MITSGNAAIKVVDFGTADTDIEYFLSLHKANIYDCPEKILCIAIIKDAVHIVRKTTIRNRIGNQSYREAVAWFRRGGRLCPFTFNYICDVLNLNSDVLLRHLTKFI